jgi:hypothetical protein
MANVNEPTQTPWERPGFYWWANRGCLCYVETFLPGLDLDGSGDATVAIFHVRVASRPQADVVYSGQSSTTIRIDENTDEGLFYPVMPPPGVDMEID